jgi:two-component sensor histidine kinase
MARPKLLKRIESWVRDTFSSRVLGTTSRGVPALSGGLSFAGRAQIAGASFAAALLLALFLKPWAGPFSVTFFFPALLIAGIFGDTMIAALALALSVTLAGAFFAPGPTTLWFALAASLETATALFLRALFRESRRWGVRYRTLLSGISAGIIVSERDGQITRPHPDIEPLLGLKWPAYKGFGWISGVHPDDLKIAQGEPGPRGGVMRRTVRLHDPDTGEWRWYQFRSVPLMNREGKPEELISVLFDVHQRKVGDQHRDIVAGEMRHRWKNLITVITSIAQSSFASEGRADLERFLGRLRAIAAAGDLSIVDSHQMELGGVVRAALEPFMHDEDRARFTIDGPEVGIRAATGAALALGIHELATNAIKYGALSVPEGRVAISWRILPGRGAARLIIEWVEEGGPRVETPASEGFGSRVIRFVPTREKSGRVEMDYRETGLVCTISFLIEAAAEPEMAELIG